MNDDERDDDDVTKPDLPSGLGTSEEPTNPGVGTGEAFLAVQASADRALGALRAMADACPPVGAVSRRRHLEVYAHLWGELGMLAHDTRRVTLQLIREENGLP